MACFNYNDMYTRGMKFRMKFHKAQPIIFVVKIYIINNGDVQLNGDGDVQPIKTETYSDHGHNLLNRHRN